LGDNATAALVRQGESAPWRGSSRLRAAAGAGVGGTAQAWAQTVPVALLQHLRDGGRV